MLPYIITYLFIIFFALFEKIKHSKISSFFYILVFIYLIIFNGFRYEVGGDWFNYSAYFDNVLPYIDFSNIIFHDDPGYWLLALVMYKLEWNMIGVDVVVSIIFFIGLYKLLKYQPYTWLGLAVAFPYFIVVVSMGYVRQAAAIGFIMIGISYLEDKKFIRYVIMVILAITFHKTAIIILGFGAFYQKKGRFFKLIALLFIGIAVWFSFMSSEFDKLYTNYIIAGMYSYGALIRLIMNGISAIIIFYFRKIWKFYFNDYMFWKIFAIGALSMFVLMPLSSTVADRLGLYFLPLQIVVFSRLPVLIKRNSFYIKTVIIIYYFSVLLVWLNFAVNAFTWLPYQNFLFL